MSFFNFGSDSGFSLFGGGPDTFPSDDANPIGFLEEPEAGARTSHLGDFATPTKDGSRGNTPAFDATQSDGFRYATGGGNISISRLPCTESIKGFVDYIHSCQSKVPWGLLS